jgi:hypothetical protein
MPSLQFAGKTGTCPVICTVVADDAQCVRREGRPQTVKAEGSRRASGASGAPYATGAAPIETCCRQWFDLTPITRTVEDASPPTVTNWRPPRSGFVQHPAPADRQKAALFAVG